MLSGDDIFIRGVRRGVELGEYVYRRGDLLFGPGDPAADVIIDERALVFTMAHARNAGIGPGKRSRRRNRHRAARDARAAARPRPAVPAKRSAKHRTGKNTAPIRSLRRAYCAKR